MVEYQAHKHIYPSLGTYDRNHNNSKWLKHIFSWSHLVQ